MAAGFCSSLKAVLLAILLTATLQGCAESHMAKIKDADARIQPKSNEATIVFFRTTKFIGAALVSPIFDITDGELKFVGSLTSGKKLAYTRRADETARFMVLTWSDEIQTGDWPAEFMDAKLVPEKTYFSRVELNKKGNRRYSLVPTRVDDPELEGHLERTSWIQNTLKSRQWAEGNMVLFKRRMDSDLPIYDTSINKPTLGPDYGR